MLDRDWFAPTFAYGPAPGLEFLPYFLGLIAWAGLALLAILGAPFSALLRRFRKPKTDTTNLRNSDPMPTSAQESPGEGSSNRP
jgi:hypothetical protein